MTVKGSAMWAIGAIVTVVFAMVILQLLRERGMDPVGAIVRLIPAPMPPSRAPEDTNAVNAANAMA